MYNLSKIKSIITNAPDTAGVYLMKDAAGSVIYVGKAKSLRKRLLSYLGRDLAARTVAMMESVADIQYQLTPTESLALLLEANLVHKFQPKYNVMLRDDKNFPLVKITNEDFPRLLVTRKKDPDGSRYIGPYTSAKLLRGALRIIRRSFPYRSCKTLPKKACIYYRLNLSPAPCIGKISKAAYAKIIANIVLVLEGRTEALVKKLTAQMSRMSKTRNYEEAAKIRDQITTISAIGGAHAGSGAQSDLEDLKNLAGLKILPERIEAFDISNISGKEATGSMVSFYRGVADKNNYRRFKIKTVTGIDDFKMLSEVVRRRYTRVKAENLPQPDLVLIDGGRAHLMTAERELKNLELDIPLISIAKEFEHIYIQGRQRPAKLKSDTPALNLIRRIRDEAHRFAVSYHHLLRRKKIIGK